MRDQTCDGIAAACHERLFGRRPVGPTRRDKTTILFDASVGEIMSRPAVTAVADETLATVAHRMRDDKVGSVIVVDGDRPVGILTERDILRATGSGAEPNDARVADWMNLRRVSPVSDSPAASS